MSLPFKNQDEFQQWKETNLWLWDFLAHRQSLVNQQRMQYANNILSCPADKIDPLRREAAALSGMAGAISTLREMNFVDLEANRAAFDTPQLHAAKVKVNE